MNASFIIPTLNAEKTIELCLDGVLAQKPYEVVIADSCSTDRTLRIIRDKYKNYKQIKIIVCPRTRDDKPGAHAYYKVIAFNMGLMAASVDVIVLVNQDTVLCENWWENICKHYGDHNVVLVGGRLIHAGNDLSWAFNGEIETGYTNALAPSGQAFSFRRNVALQIGGYDSKIWGTVKNPVEDAELSIRLLERGKQFVDGNAVAVHVHPIKNLRELVRKSIDGGPNLAIIRSIAAKRRFLPPRAIMQTLLTVSFIGLWLKTYACHSKLAKEYSNIYEPKTPLIILSLYKTISLWIILLSSLFFSMISSKKKRS